MIDPTSCSISAGLSATITRRPLFSFWKIIPTNPRRSGPIVLRHVDGLNAGCSVLATQDLP